MLSNKASYLLGQCSCTKADQHLQETSRKHLGQYATNTLIRHVAGHTSLCRLNWLHSCNVNTQCCISYIIVQAELTVRLQCEHSMLQTQWRVLSLVKPYNKKHDCVTLKVISQQWTILTAKTISLSDRPLVPFRFGTTAKADKSTKWLAILSYNYLGLSLKNFGKQQAALGGGDNRDVTLTGQLPNPNPPNVLHTLILLWTGYPTMDSLEHCRAWWEVITHRHKVNTVLTELLTWDKVTRLRWGPT